MIRNYFKIAFRNLKKRKGFTLINILGLALGFGCSILIFSYVNYHLQFDDFHNNADRVYRIVTEEHKDDIEYEASVPPGFAKAFISDYNYAEKVANLYIRDGWQISDIDGDASQRFLEDIAFSQPDFFEILNFPLIDKLGDRTLDEPNVAYITEKLSKKMFGDKNALGKTFVLENTETVQVIGVLKDIPTKTTIKGEAFISFETLKSYSNFIYSGSWGGINGSLRCYTLLRPNQNIAQIEQTLIPLVKKHRPKSKNVHRYKLQALDDIHFDARYDGINGNLLWVFSLIGFFLMAIACINFINISTVQAFSRSREIGIRKVLGGIKSHLFWQFISETFIISFFALIIGFIIAIIALPQFNELFQLQLSIQSLFNLKVIGFVCLLLLMVSFFAGSYPGIILARIIPSLALKGKLTQNDTGGQRTRKILVTAQFVISIVLIISTIIIGRQINYAVTQDLGFDREAMVMVEIPEDIETTKLEGLKQRIDQLSGVKNSTACFSSPGASENNWGTSIKYHNRADYEEFSISVKIADEDYIDTFGLKLIAGRNFYASDSITEVVVNEKLAQKLGLSSYEELIGKRIDINRSNIKASIVGVIDNFHDQNFHKGISPVFIAPRTINYNEIAIKMHGQNINTTLSEIENLWKEVFPKYIYQYNFLDERIAGQYADEQRFLSMSRLFSGLAIFISCLGLYGLISFLIAQKTREIGIRKVLGGKISDILLLVTQDFLKLVLIAGALASPLAWYFMNNWLQNYTYRTEISWWIFALAIGGLSIITLVTVSYQAIKAAVANPINSLRTE
ncbi:ABC transporter permease [Aquimarina sp. 2201CG5-10]|uniref:ABC transporter permease n=1 Tax=Aquimarina callyspongiae TaxID=3098150 RepID=UPI002AB38818|nr:ABC transporter permease [Aquimarina sp. 2201CG5-10]MDY8137525.1 ABC transporter permease [Aquimarina sp. 2201CG5-10]